MTIRVGIADDQRLVRAGFHVLLDSTPDIEVVGEAANGAEAVAFAREKAPDVMLLDIRMPVMDGLEARRRIARSDDTQDVRVLILTTFDLDEYVYEALRAGASGFLLKDTDPPELIEAVRVLAGGEALLAPSVTRRLIDEFARRPDPKRIVSGDLASLTEREREVLVLIAAGLSNDEIAEALVVSPSTAKTHVSRVMSKLDAHDRA